MSRRKFVIGAGAVAAAIALGCVVGPRFATPLIFAAEVRSAIANANTWHFTGWKLVENRRVKWEIWGRRIPFFYREQIGDSLLIATNVSRFQIVAPGEHRPKGLAITMVPIASYRDPIKSLSNGPESFIEGIGGEFIGRLQPVGQDEHTTTLRSPINHTSGVAKLDDWGELTVDKRSKLPVKYTLQRAIHADETLSQMETRGLTMPVIRTVELGELAAAYNVPIPASAVAATTPAGYAAIDLRQTPAKNDPTVPQTGTATISGITVHANVISDDAEGNLYIRFDGWFGTQPVSRDLPCELNITPMGSAMKISFRGGRLAASDAGKSLGELARLGRIREETPVMTMTDSNGIGYIRLPDPIGHRDIRPDWYLVPVEPIRAGQPRPTSLTARASVDARWYEYLPEARTGMTHPLATGVVKFTAPLPAAVTPLDYDSRSVPRSMRMIGGRVPLSVAAARARVLYYTSAIGGNLVQSENLQQHDDAEHFSRARFWADQAHTAAQGLPGGQSQAVYVWLCRTAIGISQRLVAA